MRKARIKIKYEEHSPKQKENQRFEDVKKFVNDKTPINFEDSWRILEEMRKGKLSYSERVGNDSKPDKKLPKDLYHFEMLVGLLLSSLTTDERTFGAVKNLKSHGLTIDNIRKTNIEIIEELIKGVSFYKNKAKYIKSVIKHLSL